MKTVNKELKKPVGTMTRQEIIGQLARYVHQDQYQEVITRDTDTLRKLLAYYKK